jgi:AAA+ superfamily predicted ATPase
MALTAETTLHVKSMTRALYVVVNEEDRFILQFRDEVKKHEESTYVFNVAVGLQPITKYIEDWTTKKHEANAQAQGINEALIHIYKDPSKNCASIYVITDPERWFKDDQVVRRVLNILHQGRNNPATTKVLVFVGHRRVIPEKLQRYVEVVDETGISSDEVTQIVEDMAKSLNVSVPENAVQTFNGFTGYEIDSAMTQAVIQTKINKTERKVDPAYIAQYKRSQIKKTDLVQLVDTKGVNFGSVGGAGRFKSWAKKQKATWTESGQAFGLEPPRGVLLVGVYGCGKSLSAKALANEWGLPLVQFEMGKIRSSAVGESEANLYRALRIVDSVAPCVMMIDEAEKSLSGSASSSYSDAGTTARLLGILSTWTQESKVPVSLVMTANSLKTLPPEMVNRLPERFFFDLPSEEDRIDILKIHGSKLKQDMSKFSLVDLAEKARNLVGREIEQAIKAAMVESFHQKKPALDQGILALELERKPRIITTMTDEINEILSWVGYDESVDDGVRAHMASEKRSEQFLTLSNR